MPRPMKAVVTVRFTVKVPAFDWEAKVVAKGDDETENQIVERGRKLVAERSLAVEEDIAGIKSSKGEEL